LQKRLDLNCLTGLDRDKEGGGGRVLSHRLQLQRAETDRITTLWLRSGYFHLTESYYVGSIPGDRRDLKAGRGPAGVIPLGFGGQTVSSFR